MIDKNFLLGYGAGFAAAERPITTSPLVATENGAYSPGIGKAYSRVKVNVPVPDGRGGVSPSDVTFYDYNGVVVYAYTAAEFMALDAMPDNPTHNGLTAQGWNCTLSDAKTYVSSYGKLNIGQMYITDDGKTRVYITLQDGRLAPYLCLAVNGSVDVDWGDGSQHDTLTGTSTSTLVYVQHIYASAGNYVIAIDPGESGEFTIAGAFQQSKLLSANAESSENPRNAYSISIKGVKMGRGITEIGRYAFSACIALAFVTIPRGITKIQGAFADCYSLVSVTIPSGFTFPGTGIFSNCRSLASVTFPAVSASALPQNMFSSCTSLASITIPSGNSMVLDRLCSACLLLTTVTIPNGVTQIATSAFSGCSLATVTIPNSVTNIGASAFSANVNLGSIHFKGTTPPNVSNANAWANLPTDCIIYVPASADHSVLNTYKTAANYPDPETYQYVEY